MNPNIEKAFHDYEALIAKENKPAAFYNGIYTRYENPVLTRDHIPPFWKFDLNEETNPLGLERLGVNAVMNSGAIKLNGQYCLVARVEGNDRKSFFAVARSNNPVQGFRFDDYPVIPRGNERLRYAFDATRRRLYLRRVLQRKQG